MYRDRGESPVGVPELLVRASLPNLLEPQPLENGDHLARLEYGQACHLRLRLGYINTLNAHKLDLETRLPIF